MAHVRRQKAGYQPPTRRVGDKPVHKPGTHGGKHPVWSGLNVISLLGWSVVLPTLAGAAFGIWLDERQPSPFSWTFTLLLAGFAAGCLNAWHHVAREQRAARSAQQMEETAERERLERELAQREWRERRAPDSHPPGGKEGR